jgi:hypothetical protein
MGGLPTSGPDAPLRILSTCMRTGWNAAPGMVRPDGSAAAVERDTTRNR